MSAMDETFVSEDADLDDAIAEGVFEAYVAHGYVSTDDSGDEQVDKALLHEAVYKTVKKHAVVVDAKEKSDKALTRGALAKLVFPNAPGAHDEWDLLDEVQQLVWEQLVKDAWNPTNPNFSGPVQRIVGDNDDKLVLIRTKTTIDGTTGVEIVYLTELEELIFTDFVGPLKNSVRKAAERLAKNAAMISVRNTELAPKAGREVDAGMKAAAALAKSTLELMSGPSES